MRSVTVTDSSNIAFLEYDPKTHYLLVTFTNSDVYAYRNVDNALFGALVSADSVGKQFALFKDKHAGRKVS